MDSGWTIDELAAQVAAVLADGGPAQPSGRVRSVPDRRAIRWYTTIGLVDRPQLRGRTGWYHRRHLLQLVAIKRLQAAGKPLAEIQAELAGADDATLRRIARVPADMLRASPAPETRPRSTRPRFWAQPPTASRKVDDPSPDGSTGAPSGPERAAPDHRVGVRYAIELTDGVTLLVDGELGAPQPDDITAVRRAAQPLLQQLSRRGLVRVVPDEE